MGWIDTYWDSGKGRELVRLLATTYSDREAVQQLLDDAEVGREYKQATPASMLVYWHGLAQELSGAGLLRQLLDHVQAEQPTLAPKIARLDEVVLHVVAAGGVGSKYDLYLLNPGRRPFINRSDLRQRLQELLDESYPVLIIRGPEKCGKSFSYKLLEQVTPPGVQPLHIDFSSPGSGRRARDLMEVLCSRMGIPPKPATARRTTDVRHASELVNDLVGKYAAEPRPRRVLVIDGLNRVDLAKDVNHVVARLIAEVSNNQLPGIQLVLVGYADTFDQQFQPVVLVEDVASITPTHVAQFYTKLGEADGQPLSDEAVQGLVTRALAAAPPLHELPVRVMAEWRELVGPRP